MLVARAGGATEPRCSISNSFSRPRGGINNSGVDLHQGPVLPFAPYLRPGHQPQPRQRRLHSVCKPGYGQCWNSDNNYKRPSQGIDCFIESEVGVVVKPAVFGAVMHCPPIRGLKGRTMGKVCPNTKRIQPSKRALEKCRLSLGET